MKHTLTVVLYLCVIVITGLMTFDLGAPEMIDGGGIVLASAAQIARVTAQKPDHCSDAADTTDTWALSIDPACSHAARALAYAERAHLLSAYTIRAFTFFLFAIGFTFSCLRAAVRPTTDTLRAVGLVGCIWAPWAILLPILIDRAGIVRDIIPSWPSGGF